MAPGAYPRGLARLLEQIADSCGADADEQFHEFRAAYRKEGHSCLARHRARQQRLAGTRRPDEQDSLGYAGAKSAVFGRNPQKLDHLAQLGFGLVDTRDVGKAHARFCLNIDLCAALADLHESAPGRAHASKDKHPESDKESHRNDPRQQSRQPHILPYAAVGDLRRVQIREQCRVLDTHGGKFSLRFHVPAPASDPLCGQQAAKVALAHSALQLNRLERNVLKPTRLQQRLEFAVCKLSGRRFLVEILEEGQQGECGKQIGKRESPPLILNGR